MGFKTDSSFLRYLTMGARGTKHVISELQQNGFQPIELERYSTSNKIWSTKIKRLRLPDVLCVRTGLRVEVRAKAKLEIRMSHAPNKQERHWDAGLRPEDVIALVACKEIDGVPTPVDGASYFRVDELRKTVDAKQLSSLKAASEGSEQYLTWPSIVANRPGKVLEVSADRICVEWGGDGEPSRRHTYSLKGKRPYVKAGDVFPAETMILAGTPSSKADLSPYKQRTYKPLDGLRSSDDVDRYSAAKAIPQRPELHAAARAVLEPMVRNERDIRVALEVAGAAAALGLSAGFDFLHEVLWTTNEAPMRMEALFITGELGASGQQQAAADELISVASNTTQFANDEVRQAAVWALGKDGVKAYSKIMPFLGDAEDNVALHAIAAFGSDTPREVIEQLVTDILGADERRAGSSSEALRLIGNPDVVRTLAEAASQAHPRRAWIIATMGRLPPPLLRSLASDSLLKELAPMMLLSSGTWLSDEDTSNSLRFLTKQSV